MLPTVRTESDRPVYEVEAKYRVRDAAAVIIALGRHGIRLSPSVRQDDQAYAPASWRFGMPKVGVPFARLRTQHDQHLFTVKRPVSNELACVEHETAVSDRGQMHGALLAMGFAPTVRIVKSRRTGRWGPVSLCLDIVDGVGVFLELERLLDPDGAGDVAQSELDRLARSLGVDGHRVLETYDSLVRAANQASGGSSEQRTGVGEPMGVRAYSLG
jgi:adenylate cyclase class 2